MAPLAQADMLWAQSSIMPRRKPAPRFWNQLSDSSLAHDSRPAGARLLREDRLPRDKDVPHPFRRTSQSLSITLVGHTNGGPCPSSLDAFLCEAGVCSEAAIDWSS